MGKTTIKISSELKSRLDKLKVYERETYEEVLETMLSILNLCKSSPERARMSLIEIDKQKKLKMKLESLKQSNHG
jgi:uncharacterized protein YlaN (UPF0358 family)